LLVLCRFVAIYAIVCATASRMEAAPRAAIRVDAKEGATRKTTHPRKWPLFKGALVRDRYPPGWKVRPAAAQQHQ
jgi:hypothetical protein